MTKSFIAYTDGGCDANGTCNAVGGWGAVIIDVETGAEQDLRNPEALLKVTNNQMETLAILKVLKLIDQLHPEGACVEIRTDSQLLIGWCSLGWKRKADTCIPFLRQIDDLLKKHDVVFTKVKGHSGDHYNDRADKLAGESIAEHLGGNPRSKPNWVAFAKKQDRERQAYAGYR